MIRITCLIAASLLAGSAFAADADANQVAAASLANQQGTVLVNQGEEFVTAADSHVLMAGDRVMVMEGGTAEIVFTDGCVLPLASGSLVQVPATSTCAGSVASVESIGPSYAQAVGASEDDDSTLKTTLWMGTAIVAMIAALGGDADPKDPPLPVSP
ncbi:hypothetical protein [Arenimonas sp. MALMAid1274]|uniref:hypothetical protein n=1 Tax=Arenimonas sp. MALMAid1274 TaxID=3411630 RepID=UPI003B9EBA15